MRVLLDCLSANSGGAKAYLRNMIPHLLARFDRRRTKHSLRLLVFEDQKHLMPFVEGDDTFLTFPGNRPQVMAYLLSRLWNSWKIRNILVEQDPDVLFAPYQIGARMTGPRQVLMLRNMEPFCFRAYSYNHYQTLRNHVLETATRRSLTRADRVIAVSNYVYEFARDRINVSEEKLRKIYHGRDPGFSPHGEAASDDQTLLRLGVPRPFVLCCASMRPCCRAEDILEAFAQSCRFRDIGTLVLAGEGDDRRYTRRIQRLVDGSPVRNKMRYLRFVPPSDLKVLYRRCEFFLSATEVEACPNIMIEAMSSGCAILCPELAPMPEILQDAAAYFPPRDSGRLVTGIVELSGNPEFRRRLRENALKRATHFSWERCADQTFEALVDW